MKWLSSIIYLTIFYCSSEMYRKNTQVQQKINCSIQMILSEYFFLTFAVSKQGDLSVQLTHFTLFQTNVSVWISRSSNSRKHRRLFPMEKCPDTCSSTATGMKKTNDSFWHGQSLNCKCQLYNNGLVCFRYMCDKVVPGNRVTVVGIYSIKKTGKPTVSVYKNNSLD